MRPSTGAPEHSRLSGGWEEVHTDSGGMLIARGFWHPHCFCAGGEGLYPCGVHTILRGGYNFTLKSCQSMLISIWDHTFNWHSISKIAMCHYKNRCLNCRLNKISVQNVSGKLTVAVLECKWVVARWLLIVYLLAQVWKSCIQKHILSHR